MSDSLSVMIVDDSVLVRGLLRKIVETDPELKVVATCGDGEAAIADYKEYTPNIVLMDVEMPHMDGLTALRKIIEHDPAAKVIMCSSLTQSGAKITYEALESGALDFLAKPSSGDIDREVSFEDKLRNMVKSLGRKTIIPKAPANTSTPAVSSNAATSVAAPPKEEKSYVVTSSTDGANYKLAALPAGLHPSFPNALAIGASTGGPQALPELFSQLNKNLMLPIFVTQHMPKGFEQCLADAIMKKSGFKVHVAEDGMMVEPGCVYLARAGVHMGVTTGAGKRIQLIDSEPVNFCKPSINVMLRSLKESYGGHLLTVMLTGMGEDGKDACAMMQQEGQQNIVLAQDEASSVVWGIPGAVARAGLCHGVLPLSELGEAVNALIKRTIPPSIKNR